MNMNESSNGPFIVRATREVFRNPWIRLRQDDVVKPGGNPGSFAVVQMKPGVSVVALDGNNRVYLVREHKYAVGRESLELISGGMDEGETPLQAARRELREEAGLDASEWTELGKVDPFTTIVDSPGYLFLATGLSETEKSPDDGELLEIVKVPFDEAIAMVMRSEITHGASCVALLKVRLRGDPGGR